MSVYINTENVTLLKLNQRAETKFSENHVTLLMYDVLIGKGNSVTCNTVCPISLPKYSILVKLYIQLYAEKCVQAKVIVEDKPRLLL